MSQFPNRAALWLNKLGTTWRCRPRLQALTSSSQP